MRKPTLPIALAALAVCAAAIAVPVAARPAGGHAAPSGTLVLTGKAAPADQKTIEAAPKGESVGDRLLQSETLRRNGRPAARAESDCMLVDATYEGAQCTITLLLGNGSLVLGGASVSKHIPGVGGTDDPYTILGGTGAYEGASGTAQVNTTSKGDTVVIRFE
ncbi:MAG TPA: hypothetical protein VFI37_02860 [Gaiellaceae bacterium]|jgi:hypothetical protein|nr:hypothetical protein [Gaiellaceae bacterium]